MHARREEPANWQSFRVVLTETQLLADENQRDKAMMQKRNANRMHCIDSSVVTSGDVSRAPLFVTIVGLDRLARWVQFGKKNRVPAQGHSVRRRSFFRTARRAPVIGRRLQM